MRKWSVLHEQNRQSLIDMNDRRGVPAWSLHDLGLAHMPVRHHLELIDMI